MSKFLYFIRFWLPPLIWMGIIFYFSSRISTKVTGKLFLDFIFFKSLHVVEYAALYFLLFRAFFSINKSQFSINKKYLIPLMLSVFYAFIDEIHQTYVPTREGRIRDVFIDTVGILLMYIYIRHNFNFVRKFLK